MAKKFLHLDDANDFPMTSPINTYKQYENVFDYNRWTPGTTIKLLTVPWDDTRNVVEWQGIESRDAWMEAAEGHSITINTMFNITPDMSVKVPVTVDTANRYNYVWVLRPKSTSDDMPLDGEKDSRVYAYGYFITGVHYEAPSTTRLDLDLDIFTTYRPYIKFTYCQLLRGHAPLAATNIDDYLSNPADNNQYLLCQDVNYGSLAGTTRQSQYVPFGEGTKCVMFASTMSPTMVSGLIKAKPWISGPRMPAFKDTTDRWGHDYDVIGYDWHYGTYDYSAAQTPTDTFVGSCVPNGYYVYMVEAANAFDTFNDIVKYVPQFMDTVGAMWVVSSDMVNITDTTTIADHTIYVISPVSELPDIQVALSKDMFAYPSEYADLAKLYTSPYADLQLSDNDGRSIIIRIETMGSDVKLHRRVSLAYPYLKAQSYLTGIDGYNETEFSWVMLDGTQKDVSIFDSEWSEFMLEFNIPTYTMTVSGYVDWAYRNFKAQIDFNRDKALYDYKKSARNINTAYENTLDSLETTRDNTQRQVNTTHDNSVSSATTARDVAKQSADTTYATTTASINTERGNAGRSNTVARDNAKRSADTAQAVGNRSAGTEYNNTVSSNNTACNNVWNSTDCTLTNTKNDLDAQFAAIQKEKANRAAVNSNNNWTITQNMASANQLSMDTLKIDNDMMDKQLEVDTAKAMANGVAGAIGGIPGPLGAVAGGLASIASSAVAFGAQSALNEAIKTANSNKLTKQNENSANQVLVNTDNNEQNTINMNSLQQDTFDQVTEVNTKKNTDNSVNTERANAVKTRDTGNNNASNTYGTATQNNAANWSTAYANADSTFTNAEANANDSKTTGDSNAQKTKDLAYSVADKNYNTAVGIADATQNTGIANNNASYATGTANAGYTRDSSLFGAQVDLTVAQESANYLYKSHMTDSPVKVGFSGGSGAGDSTPDIFGYRGAQVRVRTQTKGAIRMAGDQFLRYGYRYEGNWDMSRLNVMPKFSYWECDELWFDSSATVTETARRGIKHMFESGVTVWSDPSYIGKVGIYGNR